MSDETIPGLAPGEVRFVVGARPNAVGSQKLGWFLAIDVEDDGSVAFWPSGPTEYVLPADDLPRLIAYLTWVANGGRPD
jgi:hypothetical protein